MKSRALPDGFIPKEQQLVTVERMQLIQKSFPLWRAAAATKGFECVPDDDHQCHVRVTVFQGTDVNTGDDYCIGVAPAFVKLTGKNTAKTIVWELYLVDPATGKDLPWSSVTPSLSTLDFLGDGDRGILIIQNIYQNNDHTKPQLKNGKRGTPANAGDEHKFNMMNEHKENGVATYLPVIVHTINGVDISLCGTPDPIIWNVN